MAQFGCTFRQLNREFGDGSESTLQQTEPAGRERIQKNVMSRGELTDWSGRLWRQAIRFARERAQAQMGLWPIAKQFFCVSTAAEQRRPV